MLFKIATAVLNVSILAVGIALNLGIVWYERNLPENRRTLINRLTSNRSLISISLISAICPILALLCFFDRLPTPVCNVAALVGFSSIMMFFVNADITIVLRCLFKVRYHGLHPYNEDFFYTFLSIMTFLLAFYPNLLTYMSDVCNIPFWLRCVAMEDENTNSPASIVTKIFVFLLAFSLILHISVYVAIYVHDKNWEKTSHPATLGPKVTF